MRMRLFNSVLVIGALLLVPAMAAAHGGGGGGGGHGGGGGGHGGGFGGGHGGGFGGGGHYGGGHYGGGHYGGYSGGHYGGYSGGISSGHHSGGMSSGVHHGGITSGGVGRSSSTGSHAAHSNSFTSRHVSGQGTHHVNRPVSASGSSLGRAGAIGTHGGQFLSHHGVANNVAGAHTGHLANQNWHNGNWNHGNNWHNGNWNRNGGFNNRFFFPFFGFGFYPFFGFGYPFWGYGGYGYGYGGYGYGYPNYCYGAYGYPIYGNNYYANQNVEEQQPPTTAADSDFAQQGEDLFKAGDYKGAAKTWRHAVLDSPQNGTLVLMLAQALFAAGQYDEAAGAVQAGLGQLPEDQWGVVVSNYTELYTNIGDYTSQLRSLEKDAKLKPDDPAMQFLLGYHYGYLGYPRPAIRKLDRTLELAPKDVMAKKLRDIMAAKVPAPAEAKTPKAAGDNTNAVNDGQVPAGQAGDAPQEAATGRVGTPL